MEVYYNKEMSFKVNSEESVKKFVHQCQDLITGETADRSFSYVYITKENAKRLLAFIDCMAVGKNLISLTHALSQIFKQFLTQDASELVTEFTKENEEFGLNWKRISELSRSRTDLENTYVLMRVARTGGDIFNALSKYTAKDDLKRAAVAKSDHCILKSPYSAKISSEAATELGEHLGKISSDVCNGFNAMDQPINRRYINSAISHWLELRNSYPNERDYDNFKELATKRDLKNYNGKATVIDAVINDLVFNNPDY